LASPRRHRWAGFLHASEQPALRRLVALG